MSDESITYASSGVDIDEAQRALRAVTNGIHSTYNENVISGIGGFGGLFKGSFQDFENPILVSSIDGVGTKTKVAAAVGEFRGLGHDIVNHCTNDILCQGAKPLFFLDYYGCSRLSGPVFEEVLAGLIEACKSVDCALIGGETAEMPGVYNDDEVDLVGSIVGVVDSEKRLPKAEVNPGDAVIGIASVGLHTNGFTLARKAFELGGLTMRDAMPGLGTTIGEELLKPHKSYFNSVYPLLQEDLPIKALAHITGGGLYDNIPRVIPTNRRIVIEKRSWTPLPIFGLIQNLANVPEQDMYRTFNMGIGMVMIAEREIAPTLVQRLNQMGEQAAIIGDVQVGSQDVTIC